MKTLTLRYHDKMPLWYLALASVMYEHRTNRNFFVTDAVKLSRHRTDEYLRLPQPPDKFKTAAGQQVRVEYIDS